MKATATVCALAFLGLAPRALRAAEAPHEPHNLAGARVGVEGTPVASAYYERFGPGLLQGGAETELGFTSAVLTGLRGGRFRLERAEPILRGRYSLFVLLGSSWAFGSDAGGDYSGASGLVGLHFQRGLGRWQLGVRARYLPVLISHVKLASSARDTFADRYPDQRGTRGPAAVTLWFSGQRVQALLTARALWSEWSFDSAAGIEVSPLAGRYWQNLEYGQLPLVLQLGAGRRF